MEWLFTLSSLLLFFLFRFFFPLFSFFHHLIVSHVEFSRMFEICLRFFFFSSLFIYSSSFDLTLIWSVYITLLPPPTEATLELLLQHKKKRPKKKKHLEHFYFGETSQLSVSHFQNRVRERYRRIIVRSDNVSAFLRLDQCFESSYENIVPLSVSMECFLTA